VGRHFFSGLRSTRRKWLLPRQYVLLVEPFTNQNSCGDHCTCCSDNCNCWGNYSYSCCNKWHCHLNQPDLRRLYYQNGLLRQQSHFKRLTSVIYRELGPHAFGLFIYVCSELRTPNSSFSKLQLCIIWFLMVYILPLKRLDYCASELLTFFAVEEVSVVRCVRTWVTSSSRCADVTATLTRSAEKFVKSLAHLVQETR